VNIYVLTTPEWFDRDYEGREEIADTYDSAVVVAASEEDARKMHPQSVHGYEVRWVDDGFREADWYGTAEDGSLFEVGGYGLWVNAADVVVHLIGTAVPGAEPSVIVASFNAG
jgi:hypothetical protein